MFISGFEQFLYKLQVLNSARDGRVEFSGKASDKSVGETNLKLFFDNVIELERAQSLVMLLVDQIESVEETVICGVGTHEFKNSKTGEITKIRQFIATNDRIILTFRRFVKWSAGPFVKWSAGP